MPTAPRTKHPSVSDGRPNAPEGPTASLDSFPKEEEREEEEEEGNSCVLDLNGLQASLAPRVAASRGSGNTVRRPGFSSQRPIPAESSLLALQSN